MSKITVIDVMRELDVEITNELSWEVGSVVRERWRDTHGGDLPEKELRPKTLGEGGSHCFAIYPEDWRPLIADAIRMCAARPNPQLKFKFMD